MNFKRASRIGLSLLLSLSIATSAFASGGIPNDSQVDISQNETAEPSALEKLAEYNLVDTTFVYHAAYIQARDRMHDMLNQIGVEEFNRRLDQNKVTFNIDPIGQVAFTTIDKQPVGRIKHPQSGVSFIFIEKSLVEDTSGHLNLYAARQHLDGGADREKRYYNTEGKLRKIREGRDSVFVWLSETDSSVEKIEQRPRYAKRSRAWWNEWFRATYQKPTGYNVRTGLLAGSSQAMVAAVIGATLTTTAGVFGLGPAATHIQDTLTSFAMTYGQGIQQGLATAIPSFAFGTTLGVYSRTFNTWRSRGEETARLVKNTAVSVAFYFGIKALTDGGLHQLNFLTTDPMHNFVAALAVGQFGVNLVVKNLLKEPNYGFADLEAAERTDQDWLTIKLPGFKKTSDGRWAFGMQEKKFMKRVDWNRSFKFYIPMNTVTLIDQIWFTWWMSEFIKGNAEWYMPWLSTVGLIAAIPISWKLLMNFAHKKYPDSEKTKRFEIAARKYIDAGFILQRETDRLKRWSSGFKRLMGLPTKNRQETIDRAEAVEEKRLADESIPRHKPAFEGQAFEGINWFRPVKDLDCQSLLTGKIAI